MSDHRFGEPRSNREFFEILARRGWISEGLLETLRRVVGFRNILVHSYENVNLDVVRGIVENDLGDLLDFVEQVRSRLPRQPGR